MRTFLSNQEVYMSLIKSHGWDHHPGTHALSEIRLLAPLPDPASVRDFSAFEQHVRNATARSNQPMPKEWYEIPVFYFSNHHAIVGPEADVKRPGKCARLDYELEIAVVIGKEGRNIPAAEAD
jgi:2-keto-4-pentenoate hydratase/2-oxohepta-3-ene-1,7-dioic acid hydratase in catechol pathway